MNGPNRESPKKGKKMEIIAMTIQLVITLTILS